MDKTQIKSVIQDFLAVELEKKRSNAQIKVIVDLQRRVDNYVENLPEKYSPQPVKFLKALGDMWFSKIMK